MAFPVQLQELQERMIATIRNTPGVQGNNETIFPLEFDTWVAYKTWSNGLMTWPPQDGWHVFVVPECFYVPGGVYVGCMLVREGFYTSLGARSMALIFNADLHSDFVTAAVGAGMVKCVRESLKYVTLVTRNAETKLTERLADLQRNGMPHLDL